MAEKGNQKSSKGVPTKSRNPLRKIRRQRNASLQSTRKLRHILRRNRIRDAWEWSEQHNGILALKSLLPDFAAQLREHGERNLKTVCRPDANTRRNRRAKGATLVLVP